MKTIPANKGMSITVDDEDYAILSLSKWYVTAGYAVRHLPRNGGPNRTELMHRLILKAPSGVQVDHINGDRLDNRRGNLRLATHAQNRKNVPKYKNGSTSKYKGVSWSKKERRFIAQICVNGKQTRVGSSHDEKIAAVAYNTAAIAHHGVFARLNQL